MKKQRIYAETLHSFFREHTDSENEAFFDKFVAYVESKKESALLPLILREVESLVAQEQKTGSTLVVRDEQDAEKYKADLNQHADSFDISNITTEIDETIVGGYILKSSTNMVDNSYKTQLVNMYHQLVS